MAPSAAEALEPAGQITTGNMAEQGFDVHLQKPDDLGLLELGPAGERGQDVVGDGGCSRGRLWKYGHHASAPARR